MFYRLGAQSYKALATQTQKPAFRSQNQCHTWTCNPGAVGVKTWNLQGVANWQINSTFRAGQICLWFQRAFIVVICYPVSHHQLLAVQGELLIKIHPKGCQVIWSSTNLCASQQRKEQISYESLRSLCRQGKRSESRYLGKFCLVPLRRGKCFRQYHTFTTIYKDAQNMG